MANYVEKNYINGFKSGFAQAFQQTSSLLRPYFESESQHAEFEYYDRIGLADDMTQVTTRYGDNPVNEINHDRRQLSLVDFELGKPIDEKDLVRLASDPTSSYMQAMVASANRKVDDIIIAGLTATANTGKAGATAVTFVGTTSTKITVGAVSNATNGVATGTYYAITAGNVEGIDVAVDYVGPSAGTIGTPSTNTQGLTLAKLKGVRITMMKLQALRQDEILNCFITASQIRDLLGITEVIDSDYASVQALVSGAVSQFMGFRFIQCERLPVVSTVRYCFVAKPQALKLAIGKDIKADMWRLSAQKNIPYAYLCLSMGATRMWGEVCARIQCTEA